MSSRKIVCAVSGKAYTFAKDYFDKKVSEYGGGAKIIFANFKRQKIDDKALGLNNDFISDGGLKEKLNKYTHSSNFNSNNNGLKNTKSKKIY